MIAVATEFLGWNLPTFGFAPTCFTFLGMNAGESTPFPYRVFAPLDESCKLLHRVVFAFCDLCWRRVGSGNGLLKGADRILHGIDAIKQARKPRIEPRVVDRSRETALIGFCW